ncbi:hypothetical protein [Planctomyces sp. SH-PL14]|uniref:hypothetical protein n=1 Tax=Planctomyces sp. SH-PL14 TaxID=1632864 RepID=UPI00078CFEE5|nr:hypothetical protein [Planctomyces sp. SH-PL14]AMV16296.1 hypothetical protein VT03_00300 [Planctomyces sp. SH-PL14]
MTTEQEDDQVPVLEDRTPDWFRMRPSGLALVCALCVVFFIINQYTLFPQFRLWHNDLWGHIAYGRWIVEHKALPETEPLMPLARGVPMIDTAWGSQVIGHLTYSELGIFGLRLLYTGSIITALALISLAVYRRTESVLGGLLSLAVFSAVCYQIFWVSRPQLAGIVCFAATLVIATSRSWPKWYWVAVPALFAVWANLHGSFPVGFVALGLMAAGHAFDVYRQSRSLGAVVASAQVRRLVIATELAAVATLLNPYGWNLHREILTFADNPNLQSLAEWDPLTLRDYPGQAMAVVVIGLMWLYRQTPRRVSTSEILLLFGLGLWSLWTARMICWWAPVAAYFGGLHLAALSQRWFRESSGRPAAGIWTVTALSMAFFVVMLTPSGIGATQAFKKSLGMKLVEPDAKKQEIQFRNAVSPVTPVLAVEYLKKHPPKGQVYNSFEYGDYLNWAMPEVSVFVTSHVHLIPGEVWDHYLEIANAAGEWQQRFDWYGVNCVILSVNRHPALVRALRKETGTWEVAFEEKNHTIIFERRRPL